MKKEKISKKKQNNKIYAMDILPVKSNLRELEDYVSKIPEQFECSYNKGINGEILLNIKIGEVNHIIRSKDICSIMSYIEGVIITYEELKVRS